MKRQRVIVVGSGVGGLVAALELAAHGLEVVVCESATQPGGKLRQLRLGSSLLDAGPTVFTMRWVFDELFEQIGESLSDHLQMHRVETLARHAWSDNERFDLFADVRRSAEAVGDFAGAAESGRYLAFCKRARLIYETLESSFLRGSRPNPLSLTMRVSQQGVSGLTRISPFGNMWDELGKYFHDPRLQQLFGRYATYCGSSPFLAPATLMLITHVEQEGVWLLDGGMHQLAASLAALALDRGATIRYGTEVAEILVSGGRATGVRLASGETVEGASIIFNGDAAALSGGLLGGSPTSAVSPTNVNTRSLSAITWNMVAPVETFPLLRHNVFFSSDSGTEFSSLFADGRLPPDPTIYVCAQDRRDHDDPAPEGAERLLCLVNAPAKGDFTGQGAALSEKEIALCEKRVFAKLEGCGVQIDRNVGATVRTTPTDFNRLFPGTGGALYGQTTHGWMASFSRPGARSRLDGLYLAGGSVHPGPGVPMAALSGRQAASSVLADLGAALRHAQS
jgi:1-hydroxycarotenoid 3,4-desaturase